MRRPAALLAVVAIVVVVGAVAPAIAATESGDDSGAAARELTLEDLLPGGSKPANAPPSVRQNGRYGEFVLKYLPTGLLVNEGEKSPSWRYLQPGTTVKRDYVQLWSKRAYGATDQKYVVEIAHFKIGQESYTTEKGNTATRKVATNVSTYERTVTFGGGYDYSRISLKSHYDGTVRTVMCIREPNEPSCLENPGDTRYTFYHATSPATLATETKSMGGRLAWGLGFLLLPFFAATVTTLYGVRQAVEKAKAPPGISAIWWVVVAVAGLLFMVLAWDWIAGTLIRAPWLVSAAGGILLGVIAAEWFGARTYGAGFLQFQLTEGFDPTDPDDVEDALEAEENGDPTDAPGVLKARFHLAQFARGDRGERSAIRKGLRKWWARVRGASADFEVAGNMQTQIDVEGPIDELYLLDPEDEEPLDYDPERHVIKFPDLITVDEDGTRQIHPVPYLSGGLALAFAWGAGALLAGSGVLGAVVGGFAIFATKILQPREGRLFANLAPVHYHHAVGSMLTHAKGLADAKSWEDWFQNYAESEAESHADRKELMDDRSESQLEQLFDRYVGHDPDADAAVRSSGSEEASADD